MRTVALIVAILLGIAAAIGVHTYLQGQTEQFTREHRLVDVAVASRTIKAGEVLTGDMVAYAQKPADSLSRQDIGRLEIDQYMGRKVVRNLDRNTHITVSHFITRVAKTPSEMLIGGTRAITIGVDANSSVAGLIRPGDHVDIFATTTGGAQGASAKTWLVLADVTVLATDDRMSDMPMGISDYRGYRRGYSSLTLRVTPQEGLLLTYLKDYARLTFNLRPRLEVGQDSLDTQRPTMVDANNVQALAMKANENRQAELQKEGDQDE